MKPRFYYVPDDAVAHLRASDELLARAMDRVGPFVLEPRATKSLFEALMRSIVYQQLHGKAANSIHTRVLAQLKAHGGPTPVALGKVPDHILRGAGLSAGKLRAIRDLAAKCLDGTVPTLREAHKLEDAELIARLTAVRGIGPWTVQVLMLFHLGRPDIFPTGDFALQRAFSLLYRRGRKVSPAAMLRHAKRWQPHRSVASWYLWRSLDITLPDA